MPLLVSLKWPEKPKDSEPNDAANYRELLMREQAPAVPGLLAKAGMKFGFYSDGIDTTTGLWQAVKKAIDAGLPRADAIRALTRNAAEIYGISDRLGSIERGKIANLVITKGDVFEEKSTIEYVFVAGRKFEPPKEVHEVMWRVCLVVLLAVATAQFGAAEALLIRNATVLTVTKGTIQDGSVLVEDGKIAAVGQNLSAPAGAVVVDASGKFLMPGIIDCHSHTAIEGGVNEGTMSDSSMVSIEDVIDPMDIDIYRALAGGLTVSNVLHGSANAIGGQTVVIKLRWGKTAQEMLFAGAKPGIKFALGENPKRQGYTSPIGLAAGAPG